MRRPVRCSGAISGVVGLAAARIRRGEVVWWRGPVDGGGRGGGERIDLPSFFPHSGCNVETYHPLRREDASSFLLWQIAHIETYHPLRRVLPLLLLLVIDTGEAKEVGGSNRRSMIENMTTMVWFQFFLKNPAVRSSEK